MNTTDRRPGKDPTGGTGDHPRMVPYREPGSYVDHDARHLVTQAGSYVDEDGHHHEDGPAGCYTDIDGHRSCSLHPGRYVQAQHG